MRLNRGLATFANIHKQLKPGQWLAASAVTLSLFLGACASAPERRADTPAERAQKEQALEIELSRQFESQIRIKEDKEVTVYLRTLAQKLAATNDSLSLSGVGVLLLQDRGGRWHNYGLPGNRIYLSVGLVRQFDFENELAAAMAFEFGQILQRHVLVRIQDDLVRKQESESNVDRVMAQRPSAYPWLEGLVSTSMQPKKQIDYFSPTGVFEFSDEVNLDAVEPAVSMLYQAGYDPRGLIALWERYLANPRQSPFEKPLLRKLIEKTRRAIAQYSPLRNPIVRSQSFISIQKRIQKL